MNNSEFVSLCVSTRGDYDDSTLEVVESIINRLEYERVDDWDDADIGIEVYSDYIRVVSDGEEKDTLCEDQDGFQKIQFEIESAFSDFTALYFKDKEEAVKELSYCGSKTIYNIKYALQLVHPWGLEGSEAIWDEAGKVKHIAGARGDPDDDVIGAGQIAIVLAKLEGLESVRSSMFHGRGANAEVNYNQNLNLLSDHFDIELDLGDN